MGKRGGRDGEEIRKRWGKEEEEMGKRWGKDGEKRGKRSGSRSAVCGGRLTKTPITNNKYTN